MGYNINYVPFIGYQCCAQVTGTVMDVEDILSTFEKIIVYLKEADKPI